MEQQEKTEQTLSAKEIKKEEKRKQKEAKKEQKSRKHRNLTDRDPYGKLCIFRQCGSDGKHHRSISRRY